MAVIRKALPAVAGVLLTLAAWDLARPVGLAVAGVLLVVLDWHYEQSD